MKNLFIQFYENSARFTLIFILLLTVTACSKTSTATVHQNPQDSDSETRLENPMTLEYLKANLRQERPRLMLTPETDRVIREKLQEESLVRSYFNALYNDAVEVLDLPLLEKTFSDQRRHMLSLAREKKRRLGLLAIVYRYSREQRFLDRINDELINIYGFGDWNTHHWLDTATLSMAFAMTLDWAGEDLPRETVDMAERALIQHGIMPLFEGDPGHLWWAEVSHNWNQVGNGGLIAAAITIADRDPELAARTISFALDHMHHALEVYSPDGIYPEGFSYWEFGTIYTAKTATMLTSAFGHDFGITRYPGLMKSARVRMMGVAPSAEFFNFSDASGNLSEDRRHLELQQQRFNRVRGTQLLTWFAAQTGDGLYFDPAFFEASPDDGRNRDRNGPPSLIWLAQVNIESEKEPLPRYWYGVGINSIAIFRSDDDDPDKFYLGMKGGQANVNHGHMDVGSFVFELDGVRWSIDMGSAGFRGEVIAAGENYWDRTQDSYRWNLLPMSNKGHSTLVVNNARHNVDGNARVIHFSDGEQGGHPEVVFDMSEVFEGQLADAQRRFARVDPRSIIIEDSFTFAEETEMITWQMMTTADVTLTPEGALLQKQGEKLALKIKSPDDMNISVVSLDPPPGRFDRRIPDLKRIEIRAPAWYFDKNQGVISVLLTGNVD